MSLQFLMDFLSISLANRVLDDGITILLNASQMFSHTKIGDTMIKIGVQLCVSGDMIMHAFHYFQDGRVRWQGSGYLKHISVAMSDLAIEAFASLRHLLIHTGIHGCT